MTDLNTALRVNPDATQNPMLTDLTEDFRRRDNAAFLARVAELLRQAAGAEGPGGTRIHPGGVACVGLLGEYGLAGYSMRKAQEVIRLDRTPSYWSQAFLLVGNLSDDPAVNRSASRSALLWESSLEPPGALNYFTWRSGVAARHISDYARATFDLGAAHCVPNLAIIAISLTDAERTAILNRANNPDVDQLRYDLTGLLGTWYAYIMQRTGEPNPLAQGQALFSSAYAQFAYDAAGIDLAPGAHQRNTSPEHIWQAVKYLYQTFRVLDPAQDRPVQRTVMAWTCIRDQACVLAPAGTVLPRTLRELVQQVEG
jgi:hypothetical protein